MKTKAIYAFHILLVMAIAWGLGYSQARGQEGTPPAPQAPQAGVSGFTYQGSLKQNGAPVNSSCQMAFRLYGSSSGTDLVGAPISTTVSVSNGLFSQVLDFGNGVFDGTQRWLDVKVKCPSETGYTALDRQEIKAAPYALYSPNAGTAVSFSGELAGDVTGVQTGTTVRGLLGIPIAESKPSRGQVLKFDGDQWAPDTDNTTGSSYQGVVIVAKSGGNFTSIQAALDSITTASETNHYLVKVMPGVYTETVRMKSYVDIEGSGEQTTKITYRGSADYNTGTLVALSLPFTVTSFEVRFLTVENTGGADYAVAVYNNTAFPSLSHLTASASGGKIENIGIYNISSMLSMTNVTISASGATGVNFGVYNYGSSPTMTNVSASASEGNSNYGVYNWGGYLQPVMTNVVAKAWGGNFNYGVENIGVSWEMTQVSASASGIKGSTNYGVHNTASNSVMTDVSASALGWTNSRNIGVYNTNSAPIMRNVSASASGGVDNYGVYNSSGYLQPVMTNVTASASGGTNDYGVKNEDSNPLMTDVIASSSGVTSTYGVFNSGSSPVMSNVIASASGGADNWGVYNSSSSPVMTNVTASASSYFSSHTYGVMNIAGSGGFTVKINNSQVKGSTNTINNDSHYTTLVGATLLDGGPALANGGTLVCTGVYSETYAALDSHCQ